MMCKRCGQRPATMHMTEISNGNKTETHLCDVCAREIQAQGFAFAPQLHLHSFLVGLLNHELGGDKQDHNELTGKRCEKCGIFEGQIVKQGLLGCGDCYPFFGDRLLPLMRRLHGRPRHTGKVPERTGARARLIKEVNNLKSMLKEAVSREDFEQAAQLRDQIRQMEKSIEDGGELNASQGNS